jgi:hypothetical protein
MNVEWRSRSRERGEETSAARINARPPEQAMPWTDPLRNGYPSMAWTNTGRSTRVDEQFRDTMSIL